MVTFYFYSFKKGDEIMSKNVKKNEVYVFTSDSCGCPEYLNLKALESGEYTKVSFEDEKGIKYVPMQVFEVVDSNSFSGSFSEVFFNLAGTNSDKAYYDCLFVGEIKKVEKEMQADEDAEAYYKELAIYHEQYMNYCIRNFT
ncbi:hypothetical protein CMI47_04015 [Candidatus Pacearchaeota archaeon]|nr:hypothetical protein [Candidatus Pacearchaeota archaeon]|tara:strand:+ start:491 stop:916 length:426 start_codon:yes stop_codon:yes gene_type:complete